MAGALLHVGATVICPHGGQVTVVPSNTRVLLGGQPAVTAADTCLVAGCPFQLPPVPTPQPCMTVRWVTPAARVRINGQPALLQTSTGLCNSAQQIPQGPPSVVSVQPRVQGT